MGDELLNKFACIADDGEQQNSWNEAGGTGWRLQFRVCAAGADVRMAELAMGLPLSSDVLPGNGFENAKTDQQSRGKRQQNGPGVEGKAVKRRWVGHMGILLWLRCIRNCV